MSEQDDIRAMATRFFNAIEAGDIETMQDSLTPDAEIWHNTDELIVTPAQTAQTLTGMVARIRDREYADRRLTVFPGGFVQQHSGWLDTAAYLSASQRYFESLGSWRRGDGDSLRIVLAVAGFAESDLDVSTEENQLVIRGRQTDDSQGRVFLHRGIASRGFVRSFVLADGLEVQGARLEHGLLHVDLIRPEAERQVRRIPITAS